MSHERHAASDDSKLDCVFNSFVRLTSKTKSRFYITGSLQEEFTHHWQSYSHLRPPLLTLVYPRERHYKRQWL